MTLKRLGALLAAIALIVAAFLIRNGLDDSSSDSSNPNSGGKTVVICSTEFQAVCDGLDSKKYSASTEPAGTTLDRLAKGDDARPDAWITLDPFPGMVDVQRGVSGIAAANPSIIAVATDAPAIAVPTGRAASFNTGCANQSAWKCVGTNAGKSWSVLDPKANGNVLPGIADPASEADGLVTFANAVSGYFGATNLDPSSFSDPAFTKWMRNFSSRAKISASGDSPLQTLLIRQTEVNVAATSAVETIQNSARATDFTIIAVTPNVQNRAVVARFGARGAELAGAVSSTLVGEGWTASADPQPDLPAGTFIALRKLWKDYNK